MKEKIEEYLIQSGIATEEEIDLCYRLVGDNIETLNLILYIRTGFRNIEQIEEQVNG